MKEEPDAGEKRETVCNLQSIDKVLLNVFTELNSPEKTMRQRLMDHWPSIVGRKLTPHTKPVLSEKGLLMVWVDQSALAFELKQRYQQSLLKRVQAVLGEEKVKSIRVYVGQVR
jgi:predicted nucleic acid-binding Zn ribbon protein